MLTAHFYRVVASLLLLPWLLSGCAVYDHIFHPHRLGTPPMTAAAKAKYKAAEKARHKGLTLGAPATDGKAAPANAGDAASAAGAADAGGSADAASPTPAAEPAPEAKADSKGLPDNVRNTYDKNGHLKRSVFQRMDASSRQRHHYDMSFRGHTDPARAARKHRKPLKGKGKSAPDKDPAGDPDAGPEPAPDPTQPADATPAAKPAARPAPKAKVAPRPAAKPRPAVKPAPRPAVKPAPRPAAKPAAAPTPAADADEPQPEDRKAKKEKPAKVKKPKRDKNGNKLPKADPTQPDPDAG